VLDKAYGYPLTIEEKAINPMAGGIARHGYQCGMIWGAILAAGAQIYRRLGPGPKAEMLAISTAQKLVENYRTCNQPRYIDCAEVTEINLLQRNMMRQVFKFFVKGKAAGCFAMVNRYTRKAYDAINDSLSDAQTGSLFLPVSCTAMLVRRMGESDIHAVMAAGLAGGIGLSGGGCGALGAAIWLHEMKNHREGDSMKDINSRAENVISTFLKASGNEFECAQIAGRKFNSIGEHAEFIRRGGCAKVIYALATKDLTGTTTYRLEHRDYVEIK
jgi:hypothetical protein